MTDEKLRLSDWLIASDIDGTLNNKLRKLPKRNYDAIKKFVYEYGGNFILSSGRSVSSMSKHFKRLNLNSGYAVFINGAGIYDYSQEKYIWVNYINEKLTKLIFDAESKFHRPNLQIVTPQKVYLIRPNIASIILANSHKIEKVYVDSINDVPKGNWCKVIFVGVPSKVRKICKYFTQNLDDTTNLMFSSAFSFEIVNEGTNKGVAVLKVAEMLGIDKSKTAAIGDYYNDYQMLKSVGLPACCGQAPKKMKEIAKLVTCNCNKGAVADLIEYIIANHNAL